MSDGPILGPPDISPPTHRLELTHEELRAMVIAVDHAVYPAPESQVNVETYRLLTVLHERLWEVLRQGANGKRGHEEWKEDVKGG